MWNGINVCRRKVACGKYTYHCIRLNIQDQMKQVFRDKVVIVTGASSGIGKALVEAFASQNARIVMAARDFYAMKTIASSLPVSENNVLVIQTDVTKESDCQRLIATTVERFGRIDVMINNAGISMRALFADLHLDVLRRVMDVNFWGTVHCTKYALPYLLRTKGSVVGILSIAGHVGLPGRTGYSASKFAVRGFLDALRTENLKKELHVLTVSPGFTASNIRNVALNANGAAQGESPRNEKNMMVSEEVAQRTLHAIAQRKNSLILTCREGKLTVWLNKFFPRLVSRLAYNHLAFEPNSPFK